MSHTPHSPTFIWESELFTGTWEYSWCWWCPFISERPCISYTSKLVLICHVTCKLATRQEHTVSISRIVLHWYVSASLMQLVCLTLSGSELAAVLPQCSPLGILSICCPFRGMLPFVMSQKLLNPLSRWLTTSAETPHWSMHALGPQISHKT